MSFRINYFLDELLSYCPIRNGRTYSPCFFVIALCIYGFVFVFALLFGGAAALLG